VCLPGPARQRWTLLENLYSVTGKVHPFPADPQVSSIARLREEQSNRVFVSSPAAARVRIIAISGTMPDPPATSMSGPPSEGSQTK
jgi:hypothetical protein